MQIQQMRYVRAAAEKKSFSAAAKALFLSQPSLSQQILHLEKELGVPLFVRHSKSGYAVAIGNSVSYSDMFGAPINPIFVSIATN